MRDHSHDSALTQTQGLVRLVSPWFVVPADNKWFTRLVVAAPVVEAVEKLDLEYPKVTPDQRKQLAAARAELAAEK